MPLEYPTDYQYKAAAYRAGKLLRRVRALRTARDQFNTAYSRLVAAAAVADAGQTTAGGDGPVGTGGPGDRLVQQVKDAGDAIMRFPHIILDKYRPDWTSIPTPTPTTPTPTPPPRPEVAQIDLFGEAVGFDQHLLPDALEWYPRLAMIQAGGIDVDQSVVQCLARRMTLDVVRGEQRKFYQALSQTDDWRVYRTVLSFYDTVRRIGLTDREMLRVYYFIYYHQSGRGLSDPNPPLILRSEDENGQPVFDVQAAVAAGREVSSTYQPVFKVLKEELDDLDIKGRLPSGLKPDAEKIVKAIDTAMEKLIEGYSELSRPLDPPWLYSRLGMGSWAAGDPSRGAMYGPDHPSSSSP